MTRRVLSVSRRGGTASSGALGNLRSVRGDAPASQSGPGAPCSSYNGSRDDDAHGSESFGDALGILAAVKTSSELFGHRVAEVVGQVVAADVAVRCTDDEGLATELTSGGAGDIENLCLGHVNTIYRPVDPVNTYSGGS